MFFNVLSYDNTISLIHLPNAVGKVLTQAVLPVAIFVILSVNRKVLIRPNVFLCLVSLLAIETLFTAIGAQYPRGTLFRTFRFAGFVTVLWLLTPYWGQDRMILLRVHLRVLFGFVCLSVAGLLISPHKALRSGRFVGIIWPSPATQLAHYAAAVIGIVTILWLGGMMRGRAAGLMAAVSIFVLLLTHTRTALIAALGGLLVAVLSWLPESPRVRRIFGITVAVVAVGWLAASSVILSWLQRGQSAQQLNGLTGRTGFWSALLAFPRDPFEMAFGFGISNGTFNGQPIDSNWLDSYQDQGIFGIVVCALILLFLLIAAFFQARGVYRSLALFFVAYAIIASFTEDGITNASSYLLDVTVAASLLVPICALVIGSDRMSRRTRRVGEPMLMPTAAGVSGRAAGVD